MTIQKTYSSPRITALEKRVSAGDGTALSLFWQEVMEQGTPLIEPIEGEDGHYLVTFLWRDRGDTHNVAVFANLTGWRVPTQNTMTRLPDSDLWYRTYRVQDDLRCAYLLSHNDPLTEPDWTSVEQGMIADPFNQKQFVHPKDDELPGSEEHIFSVLELPAAPPLPWIAPRPDVAQGQIELHRLRSQILDNERRIWVYTPPEYTASGEPYGLLLLFDGWAYIHCVPTPTILDNLTSEDRIPPLVAVFIDSLGETRSRELPCYQPFVDFLQQELMPWLYEHYHITNDPARTIVGGGSYGGLAAAFAGLRASDTFGNVLSLSGSFWWNLSSEDKITQEWITQQYVASPRLPLRFHIEVGLKERFMNLVEMVPCARHLRDILTLKGYEVHYNEFNGGHEYFCRLGPLTNGLLTLAGKAKTSAPG